MCTWPCRKTVFVKNLSAWLADPKTPPSVADKWIEIYKQCDGALGTEVICDLRT